MQLTPGDLNFGPYPINTYTCEVTITLKIHGSEVAIIH